MKISAPKRPKALDITPKTKANFEEILKLFDDELFLENKSREDLEDYAFDLVHHVVPPSSRVAYSYYDLWSIAGESVCIVVKHDFLGEHRLFKIARLPWQFRGRLEHRKLGPIEYGPKAQIERKHINEQRERFLRGARLQNHLAFSIPVEFGIIPIVHTVHREPRLNIEMQFVDGEHPISWVENKDFRDVFGIFYRLVVLVKIMHDIGILHRDLKPDNFLVVSRRNRFYVALLDFTMAMPINKMKYEVDYNTTYGGPFSPKLKLGSELFISPTQRADSTQVTKTDDIYSLCQIAWCLFAREVPEDHHGFILDKLPHGFEEIYRKGTFQDPNGEYTDCSEFLRDLRSFAHNYKDFKLEVPEVHLPSFEDIENCRTIIQSVWDIESGSSADHDSHIDSGRIELVRDNITEDDQEVGGETEVPWLMMDFKGIPEEYKKLVKSLVILTARIKESEIKVLCEEKENS